VRSKKRNCKERHKGIVTNKYRGDEGMRKNRNEGKNGENKTEMIK
jgi:hypothetical protein